MLSASASSRDGRELQRAAVRRLAARCCPRMNPSREIRCGTSPVLRNCRGCQGESGKMKTHPGAAPFHIILKGLTLRQLFRAGIQKEHDLILAKNLVIEVGPIRR